MGQERPSLSYGEAQDCGVPLDSLQREERINTLVEERVDDFLDSQLQPKRLPAQVTQPVGRLELWPSDSIGVATVARRVATFVVDELRTCSPGEQNAVWGSVVRYVEAEAGVEVKELKVANAGI